MVKLKVVEADVKTMKALADELVAIFNKRGLVIQRYDSISSNSIYLKLDYGVCHSIRISDHNGKKHLKYRYNLLNGVQQTVVIDNGFLRYFYPYEQVYDLVDQILRDRAEKLNSYGKKRYKEFMEDNKQAHRYCNGFWADSVIVSDLK